MWRLATLVASCCALTVSACTLAKGNKKSSGEGGATAQLRITEVQERMFMESYPEVAYQAKQVLTYNAQGQLIKERSLNYNAAGKLDSMVDRAVFGSAMVDVQSLRRQYDASGQMTSQITDTSVLNAAGTVGSKRLQSESRTFTASGLLAAHTVENQENSVMTSRKTTQYDENERVRSSREERPGIVDETSKAYQGVFATETTLTRNGTLVERRQLDPITLKEIIFTVNGASTAQTGSRQYLPTDNSLIAEETLQRLEGGVDQLLCQRVGTSYNCQKETRNAAGVRTHLLQQSSETEKVSLKILDQMIDLQLVYPTETVEQDLDANGQPSRTHKVSRRYGPSHLVVFHEDSYTAANSTSMQGQRTEVQLQDNKPISMTVTDLATGAVISRSDFKY